MQSTKSTQSIMKRSTTYRNNLHLRVMKGSSKVTAKQLAINHANVETLLSQIEGINLRDSSDKPDITSRLLDAIKDNDVTAFLLATHHLSSINPLDIRQVFFTLGQYGTPTMFTAIRNSNIFEDYFTSHTLTIIEGITAADNAMLFEHMGNTHQLHHMDASLLYQVAQAIMDKSAYKTLGVFMAFILHIAPLTTHDQATLKNKVLNRAMETLNSKMMTIITNALRPLPANYMAIEWPTPF